MKVKKLQKGEYEITVGDNKFLVTKSEEQNNEWEFSVYCNERKYYERMCPCTTLREAKEAARKY